MSVEDQIRAIIEEKFTPIHLEVINDSHKHVGHAGHDGSGESHFALIVVSESFETLNRVQRHRLVNEALKPVFDRGLHALSCRTLTKSEYNSH